jgi:serine/threonine-protein kinase HipA
MSARAHALGVWLQGEQVATLTKSRGKLSLQYTQETLARYELNLPLLSISLPLLPAPFRHDRVHPFFDGLLPEGSARQIIAYDRHIDPSDTFDLLEAIGRDCAGAVVLVPADEMPSQPDPTALVPLTDEQVADRLKRLQTEPLGVDGRIRISLAGVQNKLVLSQLPAGGWALPVDGLPSTHIFKRANPALPDMVVNEAFCLAIGRHLGIPVADTSILHIPEPILIVTRFDRLCHDDGTIQRIHQEDLAQALSLDPGAKYEERTGPSFGKVARCVKEQVGLAGLQRLLEVTLLNMAVGNADAHAKNFSLLHVSPEDLRLAPAYDIMSTAYYEQADTHPAMFINDKQSIHDVTVVDIIEEAVSWGLPRDTVTARVTQLLTVLMPAIAAAAQDVPGVPKPLVALVQARAQLLITGMP